MVTQHLHSGSTLRHDPVLGKRHFLPFLQAHSCSPTYWPPHMTSTSYDQFICLKTERSRAPHPHPYPSARARTPTGSWVTLLPVQPGPATVSQAGAVVHFAEEESGPRTLRNSYSADSTPCSVHSPSAFPCWGGVGHPPEAAALAVGTAPPLQFQGLQVPPRGAGIREGVFRKDSACISTGNQAKGQLPPPHGGEDCHLSGLLLAGCSWDCGFPPSRALRAVRKQTITQ